MIKRTIQPAAGHSRVSAAAAESAARFVYRDRATGRFVISKDELSGRAVRERASRKAPKNGNSKTARRTGRSAAPRGSTASKKR